MSCGTTASCDDWLAGDLINLYNNQWMSIIKEHGNIYIYEILESHTIIEWLSRMNVKDEYVKPRIIDPGGWVTGRPGVQMVQVRTKYVLNRF